MTHIVFTMQGAQDLAEKIADNLGLPLGHIKAHSFPDGESLFRILDPVVGENVYLVARLDGPDSKTLPLLLLAEGFRQQGATSITLIAPYLPYMRQDTAFSDGEVISASAFAKLISASFDQLITVDPHLHRYKSLDELYSIPTHNVSAAAPLADWISARTEAPVIIGPDIESRQWISKVADRLSAPFHTLRKIRSGDRDVEIVVPDLKLETRQTIVLVDDIISSGATMLQTIAALRASHPSLEIICCAAHCLKTPKSLDEFSKAGVNIIAATTSVRSPISTIGIANQISQTIDCSNTA